MIRQISRRDQIGLQALKTAAEQAREKLEADMAEFLKRGGKIQQADITERNDVIPYRTRAQKYREQSGC
jgi:hypothetical protein